MNIVEGFATLIKTVALGEKGYHKNYKRVNQLAKTYKTLVTGEGIEDILKRYNPRESKEQFEQRLRITQTITPAIVEKIISPFNKVSRIDTIQKLIWFSEGTNDQKQDRSKKVQDTIDDFWGDETLDNWLETRFIELVFTDPNSFVLVEFKNFNSDTENAHPYPVEISSKKAINYEYDNNELEFLIVKGEVEYEKIIDNTIVEVEGCMFTIYIPEYVIQMVEVDKIKFNTDIKNFELKIDIEGTQVIEINEKFYKVFIFNPKCEKVQAIQLGYKRDLLTKGLTFVSPLQPAVPRMMKCIKAVSEFDLTTTLHTFPQKLQYTKKCSGKEENPCRDGLDRNGGKCTVCNGEGIISHSTTSDVINVPMPKDPRDMFDISKLVEYKSPPVELIKFQQEYIEMLETQCMKDIFVSEAFNRVTATVTATEKMMDMESVYDTLFPFSNKFSAIWKKLVNLNAEFIDESKDIIIEHKFPKDFKLKTTDALLNDLKEAKESNASSFLKVEIENDIANKVYADSPEMLKRYKIKQQHVPFSGKTPEEIQVAMNMSLTRKFDKVLFANYDSIISDIENEQLKKAVNFYYLPYDARIELIQEKVNQYIEEIDSENETAFSFDSQEPIAPVEPTPPIEPIK